MGSRCIKSIILYLSPSPATREGDAQANTLGPDATRVTCKHQGHTCPLFCCTGPEYHRAGGKQRGSTCSRHVESNHHYSNRAKTALRYGGDKLINLITALCFDFDLTTDQEKTKKGRRKGRRRALGQTAWRASSTVFGK